MELRDIHGASFILEQGDPAERPAMSTIKGLVEALPALRRYGGFATGSEKVGHSLCATLVTEMGSERVWPSGRESRIAAFRMLSALLEDPSCRELAALHLDDLPADNIKHRLRRMTPGPRQAYLLMSMEGFSFQETMRILDVDKERLEDLLALARREIAIQVATTVLIIEDEVFIARDLARLVTQLGHTVIGRARTRQAANVILEKQKPGLIFADIQLADGSSGIDAVNDGLATMGEVPVIFITAFPDQLLTGNHPDPAFLLPKPYQVHEVEAAVNHVLFFNAKSVIGSDNPRWSIVKIDGLQTACGA